MTSRTVLTGICTIALALAGCGGGGESGNESASSGGADTGGLSAEQLEHGIGPISAFELGELDPEMAAKGQEVFEIKCSACHKVGERYIGPDMAGILDRRSPAYVMNMILNPEEMLQKHPEAKAMLAEYMTPMANQNLTEEEARAILEWLRTADSDQAQPTAESG